MSESETEEMVSGVIKTSQLPEFIELPENDIDEEENEIQENKPRDYQEKSFEDTLCEGFDLLGLQYERQKKVANGVIDIFVYGQPPVIIEIKRANTAFYVMQAVVQLNFYSACFKKAYKIIAVPGGIPNQYKPELNKFGINQLLYRTDEEGKPKIWYDYCGEPS